MKRITQFFLMAAGLVCLQSCFTDTLLSEKDFAFTLSVPEHTLLGSDLWATVTLDADAPEWGYEYEFLLDGQKIGVPGLVLQDDSTLYVGRSRTLRLNLTDAATTMGLHKLTVKLHYNTWKTQSAEFQMDRLITEIYGLKTSYSQPCNETVTVEPLYDPKDNTDTLRWALSDCTGDNIRILPHGDGRYDIKAENGLPATATLLFSTKNLEKKVALDFYEIPVESVSGAQSDYYAPKDGSIAIDLTVGPTNVMEKLETQVTTTSGDRIGCVSDYGSPANPHFLLSTESKGSAEGVFTYSYGPAASRTSRTVHLHFYEPVTAFSGIEQSYKAERTENIVIRPAIVPTTSTEQFTCEVVSSDYDTIDYRVDSDGRYIFYAVNARPCSGVVRFRTAEGVEQTTKLCFVHTVQMYVDLSVSKDLRITLRYDDVPSDWLTRPSFTLGLETQKTTFKVIQYPLGTGIMPESKNVEIAGFADRKLTFSTQQSQKSYTDDTLADKLFAVKQECQYTYLNSGIAAALFVDETTDLYDVRLVPGTVRRTYVYYNRPSDCEPVVNEVDINRMGLVSSSRSEALKQQSIDYWATSEERYSQTIRY